MVNAHMVVYVIMGTPLTTLLKNMFTNIVIPSYL